MNRQLTPNVSSTADLHGLTAGIQSGDTSDLVAKELLQAGTIAAIKYYPYHGITAALDDLEAGRIGLVIKLFPVISWLVKDRPGVSVPLQVPHMRNSASPLPRRMKHCATPSTVPSTSCTRMTNLPA